MHYRVDEKKIKGIRIASYITIVVSCIIGTYGYLIMIGQIDNPDTELYQVAGWNYIFIGFMVIAILFEVLDTYISKLQTRVIKEMVSQINSIKDMESNLNYRLELLEKGKEETDG